MSEKIPVRLSPDEIDVLPIIRKVGAKNSLNLLSFLNERKLTVDEIIKSLEGLGSAGAENVIQRIEDLERRIRILEKGGVEAESAFEKSLHQKAKLDRLIEFLRAKPNRQATNREICASLGLWSSKEEFLKWRQSYLTDGTLSKYRCYGGGTALPEPQLQRKESSGLSNQARKLLEVMPPDGSSLGNTYLRSKMGLSAEEYWRIRQELIEAGLVQIGRGRGGSISRSVSLTYGTEQQLRQPAKEAEIPPEEKATLDSVPKEIQERGSPAKALYIVLAKHKGQWLDPSVIAREIKETFPKTFDDQNEGQIARAFPFVGIYLEKAGLIELKKDEWKRRSYRIKE